MEIFLGYIVLCFVVAAIATNRGRSGFGFFVLSALLSPIIGGLVLIASPNLKAQAQHEQERKEDQQRHAESLKVLAKVAEPAASPAVAPSAADELAKLAALRDKGVLTEDEFAGQKRRLLSRL